MGNHPPVFSASIRKAAILVCNLDTASADALLDKMAPEQAERIRDAVMQLGEIPQQEQEQAIRDFMRSGAVPSADSTAGIELDDSLVQKLADPRGYDAGLESEPRAEAPPFRFLHQATTNVLARHLQREQPQVIAVVVAHLPPRRAADLIASLAPKLQADVLRRVAELDAADPAVIADIELELESLLADEIRAARNRSAGLDAVSSILGAAGSKGRELLANLAAHDGNLAGMLAEPRRRARSVAPAQLDGPDVESTPPDSSNSPPTRVHESTELPAAGGSRPPPAVSAPVVSIDFEALAYVDDHGLAALFRAAHPQIALLALTGAPTALVDRIMHQLPAREARALQRKIEQIGPLRLTDIEQAQQQLARLATRLAAAGQLKLPKTRRFTVAA